MKRRISSSIIKASGFALLIALVLNLTTGCYYYRINFESLVSPEDVRWSVFKNQYIILHANDSIWHLEDITIKEDEISGFISLVPYNRLKYSWKGQDGYRYENSERDLLFDQVHFYLNDSALVEASRETYVNFPFSAIDSSSTYEKAKGKTAASWTVPFIFATAATAGAIFGIIAALTSCPSVYVEHNGVYSFIGEIFGGAVYSSLERDDYLSLPPVTPASEFYKLKIVNELSEIQYINQTELWVVTHPDDAKVLPDRHGALHSSSSPVSPISAVTAGRNDVRALMARRDQNCFLFDESPAMTGDSNAFNSVVLTFPVPAGAISGKLIIGAGNSIWGDHTYSEFTRLFGNQYDRWIRQQGKVPGETNTQWKVDQRMVILVYAETDEGWEFADYFDLIGPMGKRELVMPIELDSNLLPRSEDSSRMIRIRLESGFKFWELDYAAMDFTENVPMRLDQIRPYTALTERGKDISEHLSGADGRYYIQKNTGDECVLAFPYPGHAPGTAMSCILHVRGYYEHVRDYQGPPDIDQLLTFGNPGRLSQYSYTTFQITLRKQAILFNYAAYR